MKDEEKLFQKDWRGGCCTQESFEYAVMLAGCSNVDSAGDEEPCRQSPSGGGTSQWEVANLKLCGSEREPSFK